MLTEYDKQGGSASDGPSSSDLSAMGMQNGTSVFGQYANIDMSSGSTRTRRRRRRPSS
ncbi:hypothetical protein NKH77_18345 [Streptomyces sp. M19]